MADEQPDLTATLRALADPNRRVLVDRLRGSGRSVSELASHLPISRPAISKHLGVLRETGLAVSRQQGRNQIYELDAAPLDRLQQWLDDYRRSIAGAAGSPCRVLRPSAVAGRRRRRLALLVGRQVLKTAVSLRP